MAETTLTGAVNQQLKDYLRQNLIRILIELMIGIIITLTIFIFLICLQTNGYLGPKTEVHFRGRDEEFIISPQYLFKHEASAPIPVTMFPPSDATTFEPDPPQTFLSDEEYFHKLLLAPTEDPLFDEFKPIILDLEHPPQEEVALPKIGMTEVDTESKDVTTDPEFVSGDLDQTPQPPRVLTLIQTVESKKPIFADQSGKTIDLDYIVGQGKSDENEDTFEFYDPFNQKETINPLFKFMHGLSSQEDLTQSTTNNQHRWFPLFKPLIPIRKKQRLAKRMSHGSSELSASGSENQEVHIPSPFDDAEKVRKVKEVFNRVDNYITQRIQSCIQKLKQILYSEHKLVENMEHDMEMNQVLKKGRSV